LTLANERVSNIVREAIGKSMLAGETINECEDRIMEALIGVEADVLAEALEILWREWPDD
jgi:hypothetical protein